LSGCVSKTIHGVLKLDQYSFRSDTSLHTQLTTSWCQLDHCISGYTGKGNSDIQGGKKKPLNINDVLCTMHNVSSAVWKPERSGNLPAGVDQSTKNQPVDYRSLWRFTTPIIHRENQRENQLLQGRSRDLE